MLNMTPELRQGEIVLHEYPATVYQVRDGRHSKGSNVRLFLTNQRILLKAGLGPQRPLALHAIANLREEKLGLWNMARLEFADGHLEWLTVQDQAQFVQALESARVGAPELPPEASAPPAFDLSANSTRNKAVNIILILAGGAIACTCLVSVLLGVFYFFLKGQ